MMACSPCDNLKEKGILEFRKKIFQNSNSVKLFETDFEGKKNMTFHQIAYAKDNGNMKFYYDKNDLSKCYSLLPLPQFGKDPAYIDVPTKNLKTIIADDMNEVDIIKADIEGVWYDFCREILDNDINFKAFLIEFISDPK